MLCLPLVKYVAGQAWDEKDVGSCIQYSFIIHLWLAPHDIFLTILQPDLPSH